MGAKEQPKQNRNQSASRAKLWLPPERMLRGELETGNWKHPGAGADVSLALPRTYDLPLGGVECRTQSATKPRPTGQREQGKVMPNSKERQFERAKLRTWSKEHEDWVAPSFEDGGPEKHNEHTYSNWLCRCKDCKMANLQKYHNRKAKPSTPSEPVSEPPSSDVSLVGTGRTSKASARRDRRIGTSGLGRASTSRSRTGTERAQSA